MKHLLLFSSIALLFLLTSYKATAQVPSCGSTVPYYLVDLRGFPAGSWTSPSHVRKGNCCLSSTPDRCTSFKIYLDSGTSMINFEIASGAVPPGALYYQIGCGPMIPVGEPICISGVGPHYLTFCKPGNNTNTYKITAVPTPTVTGTPSMCHGNTTTLAGTPTGGTWSSSDIAVATVGSTGIVHGIMPGTASITYSVGICRYKVVTVTVNQLPTAIGGIAKVCAGLSTTLTNGVTGGTWASSNTDTATAGLTTGVITGVAKGKATITYTTAGGCQTSIQFTVNGYPNAIRTDPLTTPAIHDICVGNRITLYADEGPEGSPEWGTTFWYSGNTAIATIDSPGFGGFVTAVGTGAATISFTRGNGCFSTYALTVHAMPAPITGTMAMCAGTYSGLADATPGGTWSALPGSPAAVNVTTGLVSGMYAGTSTITYTMYYPHQGCRSYATVTVNPIPLYWIEGNTVMCVGASNTLTNMSTGGTWISANPSVATIDPATGVVTGISAGTATISYGLCGSCQQTVVVTINPLPTSFSGASAVCTGSTITLSNAIGGGTWISSSSSIAFMGWSTGIITGISAGTVDITYTLPTGCRATTSVAVTTPASITGNANICMGLATTLTGSIAGGTWGSSNPAIATAGISSGIINSVDTGTAVITYTLPTGCVATKIVTVSNAAPPIQTSPIYTPALHNICVGNLLQLSSPGAGTWTSSNCSIATVCTYTGSGSGMAGQVTAVATGSVIITYMATSTCYSTYTLTVNPMPAPITGPSTVCQYSTCTLSCASTGGTWFSLDYSHVYVSASCGAVTGAAPGTATIYYREFGYNGCMVSKCVTVNPATGAKSAGGGAYNNPLEMADGMPASKLFTNMGEGRNYSIYPNPGNGNFTISQRYVTDDNVRIKVISYTGEVMHEDILQFRQGRGELTIDQLPPGLYFAELNDNTGEPSVISMVIKK